MAEPRWLRIGDICSIEKGVTGLAAATPGEYPLVATGADRRSAQTYQFNTKAVCIPLVSSTGHGKKTLNYVHYQEGKFALGTILAAVIPKDEKVLDARYLYTYLQMNKDRVLVPLMRGAANVSLSMSAISDINIPAPSLAEQKKALSKLDSMSGEHAELLQETDKQLDLLKQLRQQILQDAIEGKLTADWRKNNPALITGENHASKLLEKIKSEKYRLIQQGKLKKEKPLPPITEAEKPFPLPEGWAWCRLGEITALITKGSSPSWQGVRYVEREEGIRFITSKNVGVFKIDLTDETFVEKSFNQVEPRSILKNGDILTNIVGASIGRTAVYNSDDIANINQAVCLIRIKTELLCKTYLLQVLNSPTLTAKMHENEFAPGRANLSMENVANFMISIPPLAEQQAIVECVEKLMAIIDELEKQVTERKNHSEMLMQSVLREAFESKLATSKT